MKSYRHLLLDIADRDNIEKAIRNAARKKRKRKDVKRILGNILYYVEKIREIILNGTYEPRKKRTQEINEGTYLKNREIIKPDFAIEQIIHHALMQVLIPIFMRKMHPNSCGSIPKRGAHYGKRIIERYIRKHPKDCRYVLKVDIKKFYHNIRPSLIIDYLMTFIKDLEVINLIKAILEDCDKGIPLGFYTSQWFANAILTPLDWKITDNFKGLYVRYADDIVFIGSNKKEMHRLKEFIETELGKMGLQLKKNWQIYKFDYKGKGRFIDFMGFRFYRDHTTLRRSIFNRIMHAVNRAKRGLNIVTARALTSYLGYIKHSDSLKMYRENIKPFINFAKVRKFVSKRDRQEKERKNDLEKFTENRHSSGKGGKCSERDAHCPA